MYSAVVTPPLNKDNPVLDRNELRAGSSTFTMSFVREFKIITTQGNTSEVYNQKKIDLEVPTTKVYLLEKALS